MDKAVKPEDIVRALWCISTPDITHLCNGCKYRKSNGCDADEVNKDAIRLIEQLLAENADLRKELEWKDMVIALAQRKQTEAEAERDTLIVGMKAYYSCYACKHGDYCEFDDANAIDCMNCVKKNCPCAQCCDKSRWEWRGLSEASEGGDHHEPET